MRILSIIMTHKEAVPTVRRHLHLWDMVSGDKIFISPADSKMDFGEAQFPYPQSLIGEAEHSGEKSAQRIEQIFITVKEFEWDLLLLMEYDSFALGLPPDVIPAEGGVSAATYTQNKPIKFRGKFYLHYPMLFTREGFNKTLAMLPRVQTKDRYFSDRFIGRAVEYANIPVNNLLANKKAYSKNTILPEHYEKLGKAVKEGAVFFHGVKDIETLSRIILIPTIDPIK